MRELEERNYNLTSQIDGKLNFILHILIIIDFQTELNMRNNYKDLYEGLQKELGEERDNSMKLSGSNTDLMMQVSDLVNEKKRLEKDLDNREARIKKMLVEHQFKTSDYESPASYDLKASEDSEGDTLAQEIGGDLHNISIEKNEEYIKLKQENEQLRQQIRENDNAELLHLENELKMKDSSLKMNQEDYLRVQKRSKILEKQNHEIKDEVDRLKNEQFGYLELQNEFKLIKSEKKSYKEKMHKLNEKVKEYEKMKEELERLKKTHEDLEHEKKELKLEIKETRGMLDKHKDENMSIKTKMLEMEKEVRIFYS